MVGAEVPSHSQLFWLVNNGLPTLLLSTTLYGAYVILCVLVLWSMRLDTARSSIRMRWLTVITFLVVTLDVICGYVDFFLDPTWVARPTVWWAFTNIANALPSVVGFLADILLAWRCWVIWGKPRWLRWVLCVVVSSDGLFGVLHAVSYAVHESLEDQQELSKIWVLAWAWTYFLINSAMTWSIIYKICSLAMGDRELGASRSTRSLGMTAMRAIAESSVITWAGILIVTLTSTYGSVKGQGAAGTVADEIGICVFRSLPQIFGISQTVTLARLGLSRHLRQTTFTVPDDMVFATRNTTNNVDEESAPDIEMKRFRTRSSV